MLDRFDFRPHGGDVLGLHAFDHHQGKGALAEFVQQNVLPFYRVHVPGQIIQHIVVYPGVHHAENRWDQQQYPKDQNRNSQLDDRLAEFDHRSLLLINLKYLK